ncbi:carboxypeptidase-like regulatory domain-containing protein [Pedobacter sp.]|uniref:carboxypeptidase-like regulatory domain-containing protein n=1 Tax=Pedobacter sp. TaxID=1411316 RepID=UPI00396C5EA9
MNFKRFIVLLFIQINVVAMAQNSFTISGIVKDKRESLPGAGIYIGNTKISTMSNNEGKFMLPNLSPGNYDVIVKMIGYKPFVQNVEVLNKNIQMNIVLEESEISLKEVVIKPDPNRLAYLRLFYELFLGQSPNAKQCKVLNSEVLQVDYNQKDRVLSLKSDDFLIIENKALGYRLKYLLQYFEYDYRTQIIFYAGYPYFEELQGSKSKHRKWQKMRNEAYYGSYVHFFKSLAKGTAQQEGFIINKLITIPNKNRLPDSLINAKIKQITNNMRSINVLTFTKSDSLAFWSKERSKPKTISMLSRAQVNTDTLVKTYNTEVKYLNFSDELYIAYTKAQEDREYANLNFSMSKPMDYANYQVSVVQKLSPHIFFFNNGNVADPRSMLFKGYWSYKKIAELLPLEFEPTVTN